MPHDTRILVVDDEKAMVDVICEALDGQGYDTEGLDNGEAAVDRLDEVDPDLAILDVGLPGIDGHETCRRMKAAAADRFLPVMMVTGRSSTDDILRGFDAGADDFVAKPFNVLELRARVDSLLRIKSLTDELQERTAVISALASAVEARDAYTVGHARRVASLSAGVAQCVGLDDDQIRDIWAGAVLHDVGKIGTPEAILNKPGPLTPDEREAIEQHTVLGCDICSPLSLGDSFTSIVQHHHERLDGSGYPDGLRGDALCQAVRIVAVCDIHDALTSDRPYRRAMPMAGALAILDEEVSRGYWDADSAGALRTVLAGGRTGLPVPSVSGVFLDGPTTGPRTDPCAEWVSAA